MVIFGYIRGKQTKKGCNLLVTHSQSETAADTQHPPLSFAMCIQLWCHTQQGIKLLSVCARKTSLMQS